MEKLSQLVVRISQMNDEELLAFKNLVKEKSYQKGEFILTNEKVARKLYFIDQGIVKLSFFKEDKEFIMRFFYEDNFCAALDSFITQKPSNYSIVALENTSLYELDYQDLNKLANQFHSVERLFRKITSMATINMMQRISEMLETNASERYNNFLEENNHIINRISLGDLSGYLGISQVSLSRIRRPK